MPEVTKTPEVQKTKTQPWKAIWPASESVSSSEQQLTRKAKSGSGGGSGMYGYDNKDEDRTTEK